VFLFQFLRQFRWRFRLKSVIVWRMNPTADPKLTVLINTLRECQLFSGLPPADLRGIAGIAIAKPLEKNDYLFREGDPSRGFYVIQSGTISIHRLTPAGKEQIIHIFQAGDSFAEATLATDTGYPADARALAPSRVLLIQKDAFIALLKRQPELALRMLASMSQHLRVIVSRLNDLTQKDVETRLAHWLVKRCPNSGNSPCAIELPGTKRALAAELGTVSETFSRTLAKFREQKIIEVKGKVVKVLSPANLRNLLNRHLGG
jgi:CRP/FNR family transcriptional regulator, dissimilatory nitrate respiration regulator